MVAATRRADPVLDQLGDVVPELVLRDRLRERADVAVREGLEDGRHFLHHVAALDERDTLGRPDAVELGMRELVDRPLDHRVAAGRRDATAALEVRLVSVAGLARHLVHAMVAVIVGDEFVDLVRGRAMQDM
ncbi:hypothetical protein D3C71_1752810 [compost metagenome]